MRDNDESDCSNKNTDNTRAIRNCIAIAQMKYSMLTRSIGATKAAKQVDIWSQYDADLKKCAEDKNAKCDNW